MNIQSALVRSIIEKWQSYEWTIQGFGFARTKIANVGRIHVWDSRIAVPLVSTAHTHPWPLHSCIISGELINCRFTYKDERVVPYRTIGLKYWHSKIATGEGGGLIGEPDEVELFACAPDLFIPGDDYQQEPTVIHRTIAQDGTVTLMTRPQGPPLEEADVFWPLGFKWVSAEPRPPKGDWELDPIMTLALERWQSV